MSLSNHEFFATAPLGLNDLLAAELVSLGIQSARPQRGGAVFSGTLADAYRVCLWSRLASRVLLPVHHFAARNDSELYKGVQNVEWRRHLSVDNTLAVDFSGIRPRISHSHFAAQRVKDAVVDQLRSSTGVRPSVDLQAPDVRINVHMNRDRVSVAVDLSGDSLHRRGYRASGVAAPLKENLAAAMLMRADWPAVAYGRGGFVDPMCGSGTLAVEAAWMATDTAPGLMRTRFGFQRWLQHDDAAWKDLIDEALERQEKGMRNAVPMAAFDHDRLAVRYAMSGVKNAGLEGLVHVERRELAEASPPAKTAGGLVAVNPPYGERMEADDELAQLYRLLGDTLRNSFPGWRAIVLNGAGCRIGLRPERSWQMLNGPIECRLELFQLDSSS